MQSSAPQLSLQRDAERYRFLRRRLSRQVLYQIDDSLIEGCVDPRPDLFDAITDRHLDRSTRINSTAVKA